MARKRRGNNTGTISKRADGRWMGRVSLGLMNGKMQRKTLYGRTREEVEGKMLETLRDVRRGMHVRSSTPTLKTYLLEWLELRRDNDDLAPRTYTTYKHLADNHVLPALGHVKLEKLTVVQMKQLYARSKKAGLSPASIRMVRSIVRAVLNDAMESQLISQNVAAMAKYRAPGNERFEGRALKPAEVQAFNVAAEDSPYKMAYRIAIYLGMRQGEILGLSWNDIDYDAGLIRVRKQLQRIEGVLQLRELKTERSQRDLPIPETLVPLLKAHRTRQLEQRLLAGGKWQGSLDLVFLTNIGTPVEPSTLRRDFLRVLKAANIEPIRFHDLRHTAASIMAASGVHLTAAQAVLGHSNVNTTAQVYTHVQSESMRAAVAAIETVLDPEKQAN